MIKAVMFDVDNTLLSFDGYVKECMKTGFAEFGICEYTDDMFDVFTRINDSLWLMIESGKLDFAGLQKRRWNDIFAALGVSFDGPRFEKYFRAYLNESAIPMDGAKEILRYLSGKYILCAASNGPYAQQVHRLEIAGMKEYFEHIFISEEIGASKPSEKFFSVCKERINSSSDGKILPNEIMMIGDSLTSDMAGGICAGMKTCFFDRKKEGINIDCKVDYTVTRLRDIEKIL